MSNFKVNVKQSLWKTMYIVILGIQNIVDLCNVGITDVRDLQGWNSVMVGIKVCTSRYLILEFKLVTCHPKMTTV